MIIIDKFNTKTTIKVGPHATVDILLEECTDEDEGMTNGILRCVEFFHNSPRISDVKEAYPDVMAHILKERYNVQATMIN